MNRPLCYEYSEFLACFSVLQGVDTIPAREIGYILRSLGQNPTEDDVIALICEAGCDWEGYLSAQDFISVALVSMQKQVDRMDDVRAAFRSVVTLLCSSYYWLCYLL